MSQDGASHVGKDFGNYRLADILGKGGSSVVYRAIHRSIESEVAIKVLRQSGSADMVKRFFHEAVAASQIRHPGIISVFDYGQQPDGDAYLIMEFLQGENVGERLRRRGRLEPPEAARLMRQVCGALIAAHDADIVHRDIKPQNLFIIRDDDVVGGERVKVLDFGVAKLLASAESSERNVMLGTPLYMAPEQFRGGENADHRTDVYQVGAVLYHMITGRPPFHNVGDRMRRLSRGEGDERVRLPGIEPDIDDVIARCLEPDPEQRFADMRALEDALRRYLAEPGRTDDPSSTIVQHALDQSPTIVQHIPDLNRSELETNIGRVRGMSTLASASVASGFFRGADISRSRMFSEGGEFFQQIRQTFEFYRKHLDEEYRRLSAQIDSAHKLWIACVGVGFVILALGIAVVLFGRVTQGVVTSSTSALVYFIVRIFQQREDYYREQKTLKTKYLQYGNDWLLLIQSIEAIPDGADRIDEQRRLARVLLDRIKSEEPRPGPATTARPARKPGRRAGTGRAAGRGAGKGVGKKAAAPPA
jgi:serine/threonine protein kinase